MNYTTLLVEKDGPVDWLIFNRPDALNSLSRRMVEELHHYFDSLQANYEVRVVVMRGAGRMFCAGLDNNIDPSFHHFELAFVRHAAIDRSYY